MWVDFFIFIVCFFLTAALLGVLMYGLVCLSDLESDFINPHDAAQTLSTWALPEFGVQAFITGVLLFGGKWLCFGIQLPMVVYNVREYIRGDHRVHATDIFQNVSHQKKIRLGKLIYTLFFFALIIYKLIAAAMHGLSDEHRQIAQQFFQDEVAPFA